MSTVINGKTVYETVGIMSRSGSLVTLHFYAEKRDAQAVYAFFVDGAYYATVGAPGTGRSTYTVGGWYQRDRSSCRMQEAFAELTFVFDTQNVQGLIITTGSQDRYDPVYDLSTSTSERPIEQHPNFRCSWTYNLYQLVDIEGGTPSAVPAWAATDTTPAAIHEGYLWSHTPPVSPDPAKKYVQVLAATDFGMDTYLVPRPVVTSTVYYRTRDVQSSDIKNVGCLKAPAETYIYEDNDVQWLITGGGVQNASDDLRAVTTTYTYNADEWKTKVYPIGS